MINVSSDSPASANVDASGCHVSLKLRDIADTQICRTGALGLTTNFAGDGSSKTTCSTPFCSSTSKPSLVGHRQQRVLQLLERVIGLEPEFLFGQRRHCASAETFGRRDVALARPRRHARLLHLHFELVFLVVQHRRREAEV